MWSDVRNITRWILYLLYLFLRFVGLVPMAFNLFSFKRTYTRVHATPVILLHLHGSCRSQVLYDDNPIIFKILFFYMNLFQKYYDSNL